MQALLPYLQKEFRMAESFGNPTHLPRLLIDYELGVALHLGNDSETGYKFETEARAVIDSALKRAVEKGTRLPTPVTSLVEAVVVLRRDHQVPNALDLVTLERAVAATQADDA